MIPGVPGRAATGALALARLRRRRAGGWRTWGHRRVGVLDPQAQGRRHDTARGLVDHAGRQRNRGRLLRQARARREVSVSAVVDGREFSNGQFDLEFRFRGLRHVGDGHLFDRRVVDFSFRVGVVNVGRLVLGHRLAVERRGWRRPHVRPGGWLWRP